MDSMMECWPAREHAGMQKRLANADLLDPLPCVSLQYAADELDPASSTVWFAGKQMVPEKQLKDYVGRHEKSKAVVKLQKKGQGAPSREPVRMRAGRAEGCVGRQGQRHWCSIDAS